MSKLTVFNGIVQLSWKMSKNIIFDDQILVIPSFRSLVGLSLRCLDNHAERKKGNGKNKIRWNKKIFNIINIIYKIWNTVINSLWKIF